MRTAEPPDVPGRLSGGVWFRLRFQFRSWRRRKRIAHEIARVTSKNRT